MPEEQAVEGQKSLPLTTRGKPTKFTPERLQQIINLVERGKSRYEIADILDVPAGSLQVTCSRLGISLRRPKINNGVCFEQKRKPAGYQPRVEGAPPAREWVQVPAGCATLGRRARWRGPA